MATNARYDLRLVVGNQVVEPQTLLTETTWDSGPMATVTFRLADLNQVGVYSPDAVVELFIGYTDEDGRDYGTTHTRWMITETTVSTTGKVTLKIISLPEPALPF